MQEETSKFLKDGHGHKPLPCPFCGSIPIVLPENPSVEGDAWACVKCIANDCEVQPSLTIFEDDCPGEWLHTPEEIKAEACKRWNNRPGRYRLLNKIEHLEFEKDRFYDRALKAEQMLFDQYSGRLTQEDVFAYVREQLEKI